MCSASAGKKKVCVQLPMGYSESTVAPEASYGPRGRDGGRERGRVERQCDRG